MSVKSRKRRTNEIKFHKLLLKQLRSCQFVIYLLYIYDIFLSVEEFPPDMTHVMFIEPEHPDTCRQC